jgi:pantoate--beta-alanine ligase
MIDVLKTAAEVSARCAATYRSGNRLALVPTMGFLHEGHLSLMRAGLAKANVCAASIFVNPTQFGPREDLSRYPRDLAGDLAKCESAGVSFVYAPEPAEVYPEGYQTFVEVTEVSQGLCGAKRPGHFRGVATVVSKLFNIFRPDVALFGEKDYQQLQVIKRMNADLNMGVEIVGMPIVREPDGLAMSSRNAYLSGDERKRALGLYEGLQLAVSRRKGGVTQSAELCEAVRGKLREVSAREDYLELVEATTLKPISRVDKPGRLLVAAFFGNTRLIDNVAI